MAPPRPGILHILAALFAVLAAPLPRAAAQRFEAIESGTCQTHGLLQITNVALCQYAVGALGYSDTTASTETASGYPGACYYYRGNSLWFNYRFDSSVLCSSFDFCFCMSPCEAGTFSNEAQSGVCTPCGPGKYNAQVGQSACQNCAKGKSSAATQQTSESTCKSCVSGKYANVAGSTSCTDCEAGRAMASSITASTTSSQCGECNAGFFNDVDGLSGECELCLAGKYSNAGATECTKCAAGLFLATPGQSGPCKDCRAGRFASSSGANSWT